MKYPIFSVRDIKVGFGIPYVEQTDASAIRGFSYTVNAREGVMNFSPKDYDLYKVGEFDTDKGTVKNITPVLIVSGVNVLEVGDKS